ncbi:hypothetical protein ADICEAN_02968 [Cesiribacter andamanensis AMV16]|uniref:Outer membrane protein beta-barrel domain-containing protein n=2 Tax=Cesiribacter TaxID=1133570 RepID=M7NTU9_9BACT|nr:hypothetical protein ADICEAN_02968 [Cesiribacter andamanensis AMV16]
MPALAAREPELAAGQPKLPPVQALLTEADPQPAPPLSAEAPSVKVAKKPAAHRWSLSLSAMPDMSQVGSFSTSRLGGGGGLLLGYQLGNRLRLQAGALYVRKNYEGAGGFTPYGTGGGGYGSGYGGQKPLSLNARCNVLDLPLSLQYSFAKVRTLRFYAAAGLSSYLMLSERYDITYPYSTTTYAYRNENRHWLSILNGGVGVETPLGNRLHLQAEPSFRLPLQGVGAGALRLTSFGLQLQVRYDL